MYIGVVENYTILAFLRDFVEAFPLGYLLLSKSNKMARNRQIKDLKRSKKRSTTLNIIPGFRRALLLVVRAEHDAVVVALGLGAVGPRFLGRALAGGRPLLGRRR